MGTRKMQLWSDGSWLCYTKPRMRIWIDHSNMQAEGVEPSCPDSIESEGVDVEQKYLHPMNLFIRTFLTRKKSPDRENRSFTISKRTIAKHTCL